MFWILLKLDLEIWFIACAVQYGHGRLDTIRTIIFFRSISCDGCMSLIALRTIQCNNFHVAGPQTDFCKHSYEYLYLYEEIKQQKNRHKTYFKCPYCRTIYYGTIPYYDIDEVEKIYSVNGNTKTTMPLLKCEWGACNFPGNKFKHGTFCWKHMKPTEVKCAGICKNG